MYKTPMRNTNTIKDKAGIGGGMLEVIKRWRKLF